MKKKLNKSVLLLITLSCLFFVSCEYREIENAEYPDQMLYMPAAVSGIYTINSIPQRISDAHPVPGQPYRFTVDIPNNKLIVPLAVYRSAVHRSGKVPVEIEAISDTIAELAVLSVIPATTAILPASEYTLPASVEIADGGTLGTFDLEIDLDYLLGFPDALFGLGVGILSSKIDVNPLYKTTILVFDTKVLKPVANFTFGADPVNAQKIVFTNSSAYGINYTWDFGDGSAVSTERSPSHEYPGAGWYTVTLTTGGVTGDTDQSIKAVPVLVSTPYKGTPWPIPGKIEAEDFDNGGEGVAYHDSDAANNGKGYRPSEGVDIGSSQNDGSYTIGWFKHGEWMAYTVDVEEGIYDISIRVANPSSNRQLKVYLDDTLLTTIDVPNTGSYSTWKTGTVSGIRITGGSARSLKLENVNNDFDFNWISFTRTGDL
ncbi:MAG: carbohydrate-binding protein [Mangrovibacterium sp.]